MKKFLALFGALGLIATSATTVVACGNTPSEENTDKSPQRKSLTEAIIIKILNVSDNAPSNEEILTELIEANPVLDQDEFTLDRRSLVPNDDESINADSKIEIIANENSTKYFGNATIYLKVDSRIPIREKTDQRQFNDIQVMAQLPTEAELLRFFRQGNPQLDEANLKVIAALNNAIIEAETTDQNYRGKVYISYTVASIRELDQVIVKKDLGNISYDDYQNQNNLTTIVGNQIGLTSEDFTIDLESINAVGPYEATMTIKANGSFFTGQTELRFSLEPNGPKWFNYFVETSYLGELITNDRSEIIKKIIEANPRFESVRSEMEEVENNFLPDYNNKTVSFLLAGQNQFALISSAIFTFFLTAEPA